MTDEVVISAPAKINLALAVAPPESTELEGKPNPRAGWHRIASVFSCIDLADTIRLKRSGGEASRFVVRWADDAPKPSAIDWPIEKDLVYRAHALLEKRVGRSLAVEMEMEKRVPVGGGLGGGSSDGAAMLKGLNELFELGLTVRELAEISGALGSDVAFFLDEGRGAARPALVEGFGDRIARRERMSGDVVLVLPRVGCPTPAVYRAFDGLLRDGFLFREKEARGLFLRAGTPKSEELFNDLAEAAFVVAPEAREVHALVERAVRPVHVTGSGSTLFGLFASGEGARAAEKLAKVVDSRAVVLGTKLI